MIDRSAIDREHQDTLAVPRRHLIRAHAESGKLAFLNALMKAIETERKIVGVDAGKDGDRVDAAEVLREFPHRKTAAELSVI